MVREGVLTDGVAGDEEVWVGEGHALDRPRDEFRARPTVRTDRPCPGDDSVRGDDGTLDKQAWWRSLRGEVAVPPGGVTAVRYPPGFAVVPGGRTGRIDVLVRQSHERLEGAAPFDPCTGWASSGVRTARDGSALAFWAYGVWEGPRDASGVRAVLVLPDGVEGVEDAKLYARSEEAVAGDAGAAASLPLRPDPGGVIEVFGPLTAERAAYETHEFRRRTKRLNHEGTGTVRSDLPSDPTGDFRVSSPRQEVADAAHEVLRAAEDELHICLAEPLRIAPTATGTLSLLLSVTPAGQVEFVDLISWRYGQDRLTQRPELEAARAKADVCLEACLRALVFPPDPDGRDLVVEALLTLPNAPVGFGRVRP